jgi:hypothetical protein
VIKRGSTTIQNVTGTDGTVSGTLVDTDVSVTSSYTYTLTLTDSFGNSASASATVSTDKVVLDIHKNEGVGIGKIHERGALDVGGKVYLNDGVVVDKRIVEYLGNGINADDITVEWAMAAGPNFPDSGWYYVNTVMYASTNSGRKQIIYGHPSSNKVYVRTRSNSGTWTAWSELGGVVSSIAWGNVTGKPSTFPPSSHTHSYLPLSGGTTTGTTALGNGKLRVYTTGAYELRVDNNGGNSNDVTLRPSTTDKGNVGTSDYRFDVVRGRTMSSGSNRSSKENINIFDEETAYEQIKDIPIYTFSFEHDSYVDHNIGTMIEYMPVEMLETGKEIYVKPGEEKMYSINNAIFYLMAGFKVAQRKIEDLEEENRDLKSRLERLEEIVLGEEI